VIPLHAFSGLLLFYSQNAFAAGLYCWGSGGASGSPQTPWLVGRSLKEPHTHSGLSTSIFVLGFCAVLNIFLNLAVLPRPCSSVGG